MLKRLIPLLIIMFMATCVYAGQSKITDSEGYACMSEDRTKKQTEQAAMDDAKRKASDAISTYITGESVVKDFELQKDMVKAYTNAEVIVIEKSGKWDKEPPAVGDCYRMKIKAEVIPDEKAMKNISEGKLLEDEQAPLTVKFWTDKNEYKAGEKIKVFIKGNRPFYASVMNKTIEGEVIQLLPNPHRKNNYFNGGVTYEIPSGEDQFIMEVTPPFGEEVIMVYASTSPLGDVSLESLGSLYKVTTKEKDIGVKTRAIRPKGRTENKVTIPDDFLEKKIVVKTGR